MEVGKAESRLGRLSYTLCLIRKGNELLLLNRRYAPNMGLWNGVGGKLEIDETPTQCILREIEEETGITVPCVDFKGIVTWGNNHRPTGGMYLFTTDLDEQKACHLPKDTDEGVLDWKDVKWIMNPENAGVVPNLPKFLPYAFEEKECYEHHCVFKGGTMVDFQSRMYESVK
jgi:8-oxo-dGTP diphosphatase